MSVFYVAGNKLFILHPEPHFCPKHNRPECLLAQFELDIPRVAFCGVLVIVKPLSSQSPHHHLSVCKCAMLIGFFFLITPPGHTNKVATKVYAQWSLHYHGFIITGVQFLPSTLSNSDTGTLELYENFLAVDFNQDWLPCLSFKYTCYLFKTVRPPQSRIKTD